MEVDHTVTITVTCQRLMSLAECSCRMTEYADPGGSRLITTINGQDGTPIRLELDPQCIFNSCQQSDLHSACQQQILSTLYCKNKNTCSGEDVIACLELENLQRSIKKK